MSEIFRNWIYVAAFMPETLARNLTMIAPEQTIPTLFTISLSATIVSGLLLWLFSYQGIQLDIMAKQFEIDVQTTRQIKSLSFMVTCAKITCFTGVLLMTMAMFSLSTLCDIARTHGCSDYRNSTISEMWSSIDRSPRETTPDALPADLNGSLIIYYRFGCPDCEAIYGNLSAALSKADAPHVYWIATRSSLGAELLKEYPVQEVPTGVFIKDSKQKTTLTRILYKKNEFGRSVIDMQSLTDLLVMIRSTRS